MMVKMSKCPLTTSSRLMSANPDFYREDQERPQEAAERPVEKGVNCVALMGRVGCDPVTRLTEFDTEWGHFDLVVNDHGKSKAGVRTNQAMWFTVKARGQGNLSALRETKKGDKVYVQGRVLPFSQEHVKENRVPHIIIGADSLFIVQRKKE